MTITLLGATGKLGASLARFARRDALGWRTVARQGAADIVWQGAPDTAEADQVFERGGTIVNMIGDTGRDADHLHDVNVRFVDTLLGRARNTGVAHVILASSAAVYGNSDGSDFSEGDHPAPLSPYGRSKLAMENVARSAAKRKGSPAITVLRIGNVAGADALMAAARRHVATDTPMPLHRFADGSTPLRSYIGPNDFYETVRALADAPGELFRIVNVAHPQPVSLEQMLIGYREHTLPRLQWRDEPAPEHALPRVTLDVARLRGFVALAHHDDPAGEMARQVAADVAC